MRKNLKEARQKAGAERHKQQENLDTGLEIWHYLKDNGITQSFLSSKTKIEPAKLSLALLGKRRLTLDEYSHICWALGVNINRFLKPKPPEERR